MDNTYIIHGTLNDFIDYTRLIEQQARDFNNSCVSKVVDVRPSTKNKFNNTAHKNNCVNTNRCNTLTNRRKVLTNKVPRSTKVK